MTNFLQLVGVPESCDQHLDDLEHELHLALSQLEPIRVTLLQPGCPEWDLPALLIEIDRDTAFTDAFTHAAGHTHRSAELRRKLCAALLAQACNLGIAGMADASGISAETYPP